MRVTLKNSLLIWALTSLICLVFLLFNFANSAACTFDAKLMQTYCDGSVLGMQLAEGEEEPLPPLKGVFLLCVVIATGIPAVTVAAGMGASYVVKAFRRKP